MIFKISLVLLTLILFSILWMLFTPVRLYVDTDTAKYEIKQKGTFHISAYFTKEIQFQLRVFGIQINKGLGGLESSPRQEPMAAKKGTRKPPGAWFTLAHQILNSISIKRFHLNVDTGDVVLNAQLVPLLCFVQYKDFKITTNFTGRLYAHVEAEAYPRKMLWTYLKFLTTNK